MAISRLTHLRFLLGLLLGISGGLLYGWLVQPIEYVNTTPASLRQDFQVDYMLTLAEAYPTQGDLDWVRQHLALLGPSAPDALLDRALSYARSNDYNPADVGRLERLAGDLRSQGGQPPIEAP